MTEQTEKETAIRALRAHPEYNQDVIDGLKQGVARFGWSYDARANLLSLRDKIATTGWDSLEPQEREWWQPFLLELKPGDWLVYVNVPSYGLCTAARVAEGGYHWRPEQRPDFNHQVPVDPATVATFDRNASYVHPHLARRLKLQGRTWRVHAAEEFAALLDALESGVPATPRSVDETLGQLEAESAELLNQIAERVLHTHPNYGLEHLLELAFKNAHGVFSVERRGGAHDHGADLIVRRREGLVLRLEITTLVQVKAYQNELHERQAIEDIRRAFNKYEADEAVIASTALALGPGFEEAVEELSEELGKPVHVLFGAQLAAFLVRHAWSA